MKRKYVSLTAEDKLSLIKKIENGCEKRKVDEEFGVGYSTACAIVKDKTRLLAAENSGQNLIKRNRQLKYDNIDKAVAIWFDQMRTANVPVNGDMGCEQRRRNSETSSGRLHLRPVMDGYVGSS